MIALRSSHAKEAITEIYDHWRGSIKIYDDFTRIKIYVVVVVIIMIRMVDERFQTPAYILNSFHDKTGNDFLNFRLFFVQQFDMYISFNKIC